MNLPTHHSNRRESVIAGLAAALVAVAMLVVAGKASAAERTDAPASPAAVTAPATGR
jgi:hypothetical protein